MQVRTFSKKMQGKFFSVQFIKKDGTTRKIVGRLDCCGVSSVYIGRGGKKYVRLVTMPQKQVKSFALDRLIGINARHQKIKLNNLLSKRF